MCRGPWSHAEIAAHVFLLYSNSIVVEPSPCAHERDIGTAVQDHDETQIRIRLWRQSKRLRDARTLSLRPPTCDVRRLRDTPTRTRARDQAYVSQRAARFPRFARMRRATLRVRLYSLTRSET